MEIVLNQMALRNFKGIRALTIDFKTVTNIYGQNGLGKTTIFDAFLWLLFGKDSSDRKDFEIKTLDAEGQPLSKLEHEVSAILYADGQRIELRRVYKEKWAKKRGSATSEMTGHEQLFFWNDVPMAAGEFAARVTELMPENLFKLVTNPLYFNQMKWQDRRLVLVQMAGGIEAPEVMKRMLAGNMQRTDLVQINELEKILKGGKSLSDWKAQLGAQKKKIREALQHIPARIDEANRAIPEALDFNDLRIQQARLEEQIAQIDEELQSATAAQQAQMTEYNDRQRLVFQVKSEMDTIRYQTEADIKEAGREAERRLQDLRRDLSHTNEQKQKVERAIAEGRTRLESIEQLLNIGRQNWANVNAEHLVFQPGEFCCPACQREFEPELIEVKRAELTANFNSDKQRRIDSIVQKGEALKKEQAALNEQELRLREEAATLHQEAHKIQELLDATLAAKKDETPVADLVLKALQANEEYQAKLATYDNLRKQQAASETQGSEDTETLARIRKDKKAGFQVQLDAVKRQLATEDQIEAGKRRVQQLQDEERDLAQQLADVEGQEYLVEQYNRAAMDLLEERINGKFKAVRFKLFDQQINGGEVECCDTLINGVPWSDANNAAKVNAGIDIINALCRHHGVHAPIFIDNRESVNDLVECASQIINLIVSRDAQLKVA